MKANRLALVGVVFGLAGAVLLALFVASSGDDVATERVGVLVAPDDGLEAGALVSEVTGLAETRQYPVDVVPQRALTTLDDVAGQRVARPVGPGEVLTVDQFAAVGPASGGVVVPEGWEAVSVEAQPAPGVEGYATVGSLVNIYMSGLTPLETGPDEEPLRGTAEAFTQLVLGHTEVLAVTRGTLTGESTAAAEASASGGLVFLLKVRPEDVPALVFAEDQGQLWFSLVNPDDPAPSAERFTFDALDPDAITAAIGQARAQLDADRAREQVETTEAALAAPAEAAEE